MKNIYLLFIILFIFPITSIAETERRLSPISNDSIKNTNFFSHLFSNSNSQQKIYIGTELGWSKPRNLTNDMKGDKLQQDFFAAIKIGYKWNDYLSSELFINNAKYNYNAISVGNKPSIRSINRKQTLRNNSFLFNNYLTFFTYNNISLYSGIGIGISKNHLSEQLVTTTFVNGKTFDYTVSGRTIYRFTWSPSIGVNYQQTKNIGYGLLYRYIDAGIFSAGKDVFVKGQKKREITFDKSKLRSHQILFSINYLL